MTRRAEPRGQYRAGLLQGFGNTGDLDQVPADSLGDTNPSRIKRGGYTSGRRVAVGYCGDH